MFVASVKKENKPVPKSCPKKPILAVPSLYLNSIPLSLLWVTVFWPIANTGSAIVTMVEFMTVLVPWTVKSLTAKSKPEVPPWGWYQESPSVFLTYPDVLLKEITPVLLS